MAAYVLLVWTMPVDQKDDIFNAWYNEVHLREICALPEFKDATRFKFVSGDQPAADNLAIYNVETEQPESFLVRLNEASANMEISPALDVSAVRLQLMRRMGP